MATTDSPSPPPRTGWGGARPGAGRKRKPTPDPEVRSLMRQAVSEQILPDLPRIIEVLKSAAFGARVVGDAGERAYTVPPDTVALACLVSLIDHVC